MKKLLGIVVLGLLLSNNAYAKSYKINTIWYSDNGIVFKMFNGGSKKKLAGSLDIRNKKAISHCNKISKDAYVFKSGGMHDEGDHQSKDEVFKTYFRYFCANSLSDALILLNEGAIPNYIYSSELISITHFEKNGLMEESVDLNLIKQTNKLLNEERIAKEKKKEAEKKRKAETKSEIDWGKVAGEFDPKYKQKNKRVCTSRKTTAWEYAEGKGEKIITCTDQ